MTDPITLAIAGAIATGIATRGGESLSNAAENAINALTRRVRDRFRGRAADEATLEAASTDPGSEEKALELAVALQRVMSEDPAFGADVRALWSQVRTEATAQDDGVVNNFHGQAHTSIQMRDVHGGLTIN